jgi:hypothetical protein
MINDSTRASVVAIGFGRGTSATNDRLSSCQLVPAKGYGETSQKYLRK